MEDVSLASDNAREKGVVQETQNWVRLLQTHARHLGVLFAVGLAIAVNGEGDGGRRRSGW